MIINNIGSGSKGNATIISDGKTHIQIDAGLSISRMKEGLDSLCLTKDDVSGLLITHSHVDHIKNYQFYPVEKRFGGRESLPAGEIEEEHILQVDRVYELNSLVITPFKLSHDTPCFGYIIKSTIDDETLVYMTDTGFVPEDHFNVLKNATHYIIEANHDPNLELTSSRPVYLIKRNMSNTGHLNNTDACYYLSVLIGDKTKTISFAHLSEECNTSDLVLEAYNEVMLAQHGSIPDAEVNIFKQDEMTFVQKSKA